MEVTKQINAGSYQRTINGGGNYTGTKTVEWKILPKTVENPTIEVSSVTYTARHKLPVLRLKTVPLSFLTHSTPFLIGTTPMQVPLL